MFISHGLCNIIFQHLIQLVPTDRSITPVYSIYVDILQYIAIYNASKLLNKELAHKAFKSIRDIAHSVLGLQYLFHAHTIAHWLLLEFFSRCGLTNLGTLILLFELLSQISPWFLKVQNKKSTFLLLFKFVSPEDGIQCAEVEWMMWL